MNHLLTPALLLLSLLSAHAAIEITPLVECLCESGSAPQQAFQLTAEGSAGPFTFWWSREGGEFIPSDEQNPTDISLPGKYIVEVTNAYGCTFPYEIEIPACPIPTISGTITETCAGQPTGSITVEVTGGAEPYTYIWSNGSGDTPVITGLAEGSYYLTVQDSRGCRETRTYKVLAGSLAAGTHPVVVTDANGCTANAANPGIRWHPPDFLSCDTCLAPTARPLQTIAYQALLTDSLGCTAAATATIYIEKQSGIYMPNAFSPNEDGRNDRLAPYADGTIQEVESFRIFNRWGGLLFERTGFLPNEDALGWDGEVKGEQAPPGLYLYQLQTRKADGQVVQLGGEVLLIR